jgi:selenocysteine lyase/cysteine desulfurase
MNAPTVKAYFNCAGLSRPLAIVADRVKAAECEFGDLLYSEAGIEKFGATLNDCRCAIATLLGVDGPRGVSLMANASTAVSFALTALGVTLEPGALIVTSDEEHPCVERPLNVIARRGIEVAKIAADSEAQFLEAFRTILEKRTPGLVILSHVSYKNGKILPVDQVGAMLAEKPIPYIVDGAQAFAQIALNVPRTKAWSYVFSGHKWLHGPWGTGGLWTSEAFIARNKFALSTWDGDRDLPNGGNYEGGTMNYALIAGLLEACRSCASELDHRIESLKRLCVEIGAMLDRVWPSATASWDGATAPGILAYLMKSGVNSWVVAEHALARHGVAIKPFRPPERPDAIRISFSPWTTRAEIALLSAAIHDLATIAE